MDYYGSFEEVRDLGEAEMILNKIYEFYMSQQNPPLVRKPTGIYQNENGKLGLVPTEKLTKMTRLF